MTTPTFPETHEHMVELGWHLVERGDLSTLQEVLVYFEKPWKWENEWYEYLAEQEGESA